MFGEVFAVMTKNGYPICDNCKTKKEATACMRELYIMDKKNGVFEKDYYKIVKVTK